MSRPHWTHLGLPQGKCSRKGCGAALPVVPASVWWDGDDLVCRPCALEAGAPEPPDLGLGLPGPVGLGAAALKEA